MTLFIYIYRPTEKNYENICFSHVSFRLLYTTTLGAFLHLLKIKNVYKNYVSFFLINYKTDFI